MWVVYRRIRKDEDYANYKGTLIAATAEIRLAVYAGYYKHDDRTKQTSDCFNQLYDNTENIFST